MGHAYPQLHDPEWLRRQYLELGRTRRDICAELGCSTNTLGRAIARHGLHRGKGDDVPAEVPAEWLRSAYIHQRRSVAQLAAGLAIPPQEMRNALRSAGIALRPEDVDG